MMRTFLNENGIFFSLFYALVDLMHLLLSAFVLFCWLSLGFWGFFVFCFVFSLLCRPLFSYRSIWVGSKPTNTNECRNSVWSLHFGPPNRADRIHQEVSWVYIINFHFASLDARKDLSSGWSSIVERDSYEPFSM